MTLVSKNVYTDKLNDTVNKYNNKYYRRIKIKLVDVKDNKYVDFDKEVYDKNPKFNVGDECHVRILKYKSIFAIGYTRNWSEEVFVVKKLIIQYH